MLGRQRVYIRRPVAILAIARNYGFNMTEPEVRNALVKSNYYADELLKLFGCSTVESMDISAFEGANVVWDLNNPIPKELENQYDIVFDGGTIEHVFNVPIALSNCARMLKTGGSFISTCPANNYFGHGMYQFCPELFYQAFSLTNGFKTDRMLITQNLYDVFADWYEVREPSKIKERVELHNALLTTILFETTKIGPASELQAQQSDYVAMWNESTSIPGIDPGIIKNCLAEAGVRHFIAWRLPDISIIHFYRKIKLILSSVSSSLFGPNQTHFKKYKRKFSQ